MKIEIDTTFDFNKLKNRVKDILKESRVDNIEQLAEKARDNIKNGRGRDGKFAPISPNTGHIRREGLSKKARPRKSESTKPLIHSGKLLKSIKATKTGIRMKKYGVYHLQDNKIVENAFTKAYKRRFGKDLSKGTSPARNFMPQASDLDDKSRKRILKLLKRALRK